MMTRDVIVDQARQEDVVAIQTLLRQRPGADNGFWMPTVGCQIFVARDEDGIAAWLMLRVDHDRRAVTADQLEGWRDGGRVSARGVLGMRRLGEMLHEKADELDYDVYCLVANKNQRHGQVLIRHFAYTPEMTLYRRRPHGSR